MTSLNEGAVHSRRRRRDAKLTLSYLPKVTTADGYISVRCALCSTATAASTVFGYGSTTVAIQRSDATLLPHYTT